jgi:3'(2'), 5'-bisphosphate nucleotidase
MHFYEEGAEVTWKKDASPLTSADSSSHDFLVESVRSLTLEVPIISEESEEAAEGLIGHAKWFWLVDPLDVTKEFLKGTNEFTVNVALIEAGLPILRVVHAPALRVTIMVWEISDRGARLMVSRPSRFRPGKPIQS